MPLIQSKAVWHLFTGMISTMKFNKDSDGSQCKEWLYQCYRCG